MVAERLTTCHIGVAMGDSRVTKGEEQCLHHGNDGLHAITGVEQSLPGSHITRSKSKGKQTNFCNDEQTTRSFGVLRVYLYRQDFPRLRRY